jgi:hypothetical protein
MLFNDSIANIDKLNPLNVLLVLAFQFLLLKFIFIYLFSQRPIRDS